MTPRDRVRGPSGRREAAGDVGHRQGFPTPADGSRTRPERRLPKAFGQRCAGFAMSRIAAVRTPCRKPWEAVSRGHYQHSLILPYPQRYGHVLRRAPAFCASLMTVGGTTRDDYHEV